MSLLHNKQNTYQPPPLFNQKTLPQPHRRSLTQLVNETGCFPLPQTDSFQIQTDGQEKLIELTAQCTSYFQRFTKQKDSQTAVVGRVFLQIKGKVHQAFGKVIEQAQRKRDQICDFLDKQEKRLIDQKLGQEQTLGNILSQIQTVHLSKLQSSCQSKEQLRSTLAGYAGTLDHFFSVMMDIQKNGYQQSVQQSVNFINNLIREQLQRLIDSTFPQKADDIIGSFTNQRCFTFQSEGEGENYSCGSLFLNRVESREKVKIGDYGSKGKVKSELMREIEGIGEAQKDRAKRIGQYRSVLLGKNVFEKIKLWSKNQHH